MQTIDTDKLWNLHVDKRKLLVLCPRRCGKSEYLRWYFSVSHNYRFLCYTLTRQQADDYQETVVKCASQDTQLDVLAACNENVRVCDKDSTYGANGVPTYVVLDEVLYMHAEFVSRIASQDAYIFAVGTMPHQLGENGKEVLASLVSAGFEVVHVPLLAIDNSMQWESEAVGVL